MTEVVDFTQKLREHRRRRQATCQHVQVSTDRRGIEVCVACGDAFPCRSPCGHVDCWIRRGEINHLDVPDRKDLAALAAVRVTDASGKVLFDTLDDDELEWFVPGVRYG